MEIKDIKQGIIIDGVVYELCITQTEKDGEVASVTNVMCHNAMKNLLVALVCDNPGIFRKVEINERTDQREYNDDINFKKIN